MTPSEQVMELAKAAGLKLDETFNAPDVLPFTTEALTIIRSHPDLQATFEETFLNMTAVAPPEFVEVCMHALRWTTVKLAFEQRHREVVAQNDWRREPYYRHCLDAFEDKWEDANDFYASYFRGPNAA
ncbi:hypothetical protein [Variovorax paradoxus]|uniref:hypothetical protein n=1 Tax=Variovorax paradoxus TaxID=34073 RepID=UPI0029C958AF|nr:hypothetical protein [Variovorax paradoxus]WPH20816.1 hypothetical protein RZE78_01330 [Variovorax paradoxus]